MTLTSYESLSRWFLDPNGTEATPHWNLYAIDYGQTEKLIGRYVKGDDMETSGRHLERMIRDLNNPDGSKFRVMVYPPGKHNNSNKQAYVQVYERSQAPANTAHAAGIAGLPAGIGSVEQYVNERLETERLKWELGQLKEQINAPSEKWERVLEYVSGVPGIDKVLQTVALGLVSKFNPSAMPAIQAAMNGTPQATGEPDGDDEEASPDQVFLENIQEASATLGTDPVTMAKKLNNLIKTNPDLARQLLQQQ